MNILHTILPYIQVVLSILVIAAVLLQQSTAGLGGAFGESDFGTIHHTRRGAEKFLWNSTIILAILFGLSALAALKI